jgi:RNA polymerase sigma-70 factor (ECF subfamily)
MSTTKSGDRDMVTSAVLAGDESGFASLAERHRRELQVHCYRMLGSFEDSEDLVQETFLRAWRWRASFTPERGSSFRAWLYRIATNACLDALARSPRRVLPSQLGPPADPDDPALPYADLPWLQPYPDHMLEGLAQSEDDPDAVVVARETIELAFLAAMQLLPPRQRAVLILRDVLGWSAKETAASIDASVASVNSALQRARSTLKAHVPRPRAEWAPVSSPSAEERAVVARFMDAVERGDLEAIAEHLHEDLVANMPPYPFWYDGREANLRAMSRGLDPASPEYHGERRWRPTTANMQPAAAFYVRPPGASEFQLLAVDVMRVEDGKVTDITAFLADLPYVVRAFRLPATLETPRPPGDPRTT